MALVDSLAQAYRWPLRDILDLTLPQVYMLNRAASYNKQRLDRMIEQKRRDGTLDPSESLAADPPLVHGKRLDELTSDEYLSYMGASSGDGVREVSIKRHTRTHGQTAD